LRSARDERPLSTYNRSASPALAKANTDAASPDAKRMHALHVVKQCGMSMVWQREFVDEATTITWQDRYGTGPQLELNTT
jgi:hypothetical protein